MPSFFRSSTFQLNVASTVMDRDRLFMMVRRLVPLYWFVRPWTRFMMGRSFPRKLVGVEVGVDYGLNARVFLRFLPLERLYLIDPYSETLDRVSGDERFVVAQRYLKRFSGKVRFIRKPSVEAAGEIPDELDFVYLDGCHEYECVKKDLEVYYPKVRVGGFLCGHDFWANTLGVCQAVVEFAADHHLELQGSLTDWWIEKPASDEQ
jgi:hypothetical protein